jgi:hypothetical protein
MDEDLVPQTEKDDYKSTGAANTVSSYVVLYLVWFQQNDDKY